LQTSALEKVLADKALYDSLREKAKAMARDRYSDRLCADKLIELYSGIIAQ
jgi:glycosyltransferase involved in cell wall biosynthesis